LRHRKEVVSRFGAQHVANQFLFDEHKKPRGLFQCHSRSQSPGPVWIKFLSDLGFASSSDRLLIQMLKALKMTDENGVPTQRYFEFLDQSRSRQVLASAVRDAYEDLFTLILKAQELPADQVRNKLRTLTQGQKSDDVLGKMATTFKALCELADWESPPQPPQTETNHNNDVQKEPDLPPQRETHLLKSSQLHYNLQIHLPESRDPAVFEAIFQALKKHLF
jgi:hypothetical protein